MKRNFAFMLAAFLFACILFSIPLSSYAFELGDLGATKWKYYAGVPEHQELEADSTGSGNLCPKYSTLQCLEILYNAWYGLKSDSTNTLLDLDIRYFAGGGGMVIGSVFDKLCYNSNTLPSAYAKQNLNTFPNYDHAYFRIYSPVTLWDMNATPNPIGTPNLTQIQDAIDQTPVIIRINNYTSEISGTVQSTSYDGDIVEISGAGSGFHYVVVVNYGTENGVDFLECMNSYGVAAGGGTYTQNGYGDFFRVNTDNFTSWCDEAYYLCIHDVQEDFTSDDLYIPCAAKIFPGLMPDLHNDYIDKDNMETGEALYIHGDVSLSSSTTIPNGRTVYVEPADAFSSHTITVPAGKTLNVGESSGATITRLGSSGYWTSITVQDSGKISLYPGSIVEYAKTGITSLSNETDAIKVYPAYSPYATIRHCRDFGIYTYNCSPTISLLKLIYHDNLYYPSTGIRVAGSISNPTISTVTFDSTQTEFSMEPYTDASLGYSDLRNAANVVDNIYIGAYSSLNMDGLYGSNGYNNIYPGSGYTINNVPSSDWVEAGCNYFAGSPSFRQSIMINYLESSFGSACNNGAPPLSKPAILASNPFAEEKSREEIGDWSGAIAIYKDILANNSEISARRRAIKSILHASEQRNIKNKTNDYREIRSIVLTELNSATSAYKAVLDYLLCEILVKEGKYSDAISSYAAQAVKYSGTSMEVEMLTRVATLYGMQLKNKVKAREFADRASAINPGQDYLYIAYRAAGAEYLPWQYADKFKGIEENFDTPPEQPKPTAEDEYVAINPNPANPVATITYSINSPSNVRLSIYSITGQKVATLADGPMSAGTHSVIFDGSKYASGVYFYRFESAGLTKSGKMLLLK